MASASPGRALTRRTILGSIASGGYVLFGNPQYRQLAPNVLSGFGKASRASFHNHQRQNFRGQISAASGPSS
jgi:hypothetical protein